ncbi:MAG: hypothetical protein B0A82_20490 [Alkalinema sp. CACIAM 70d]|nr:MAG: hypothetical protein B0A82_20490 [Alkalinema sp. CACIAM 70d]
MRKLIIFKADRGEIQKYRQQTGTRLGESFYRVANANSVPSLVTTIAEHYDCSNKPLPEVGYRLTEIIPENRDCFRDSGWEVARVSEYLTEQPLPEEGGFDAVCICYCVYKPLDPDIEWSKEAYRMAPTLDSFGGNQAAYDQWLETQKQPIEK